MNITIQNKTNQQEMELEMPVVPRHGDIICMKWFESDELKNYRVIEVIHYPPLSDDEYGALLYVVEINEPL